MKTNIKSVNIDFWIDNKGKQFECCEDVEKLMWEIKQFIENKGYCLPEKMCSNNPRFSIHVY